MKGWFTLYPWTYVQLRIGMFIFLLGCQGSLDLVSQIRNVALHQIQDVAEQPLPHKKGTIEWLQVTTFKTIHVQSGTTNAKWKTVDLSTD